MLHLILVSLSFQQNIQLERLEDASRDFENSIAKNPDFPTSYIQKSYSGKFTIN